MRRTRAGHRLRGVTVGQLDAEALSTKGEFKGRTYRQRAYYWLVGHTDTTNSHLKRTLLDMRDRVFKGYNQRWAYVMLSSNYGLEGTEGPSGDEIGAEIEQLKC